MAFGATITTTTDAPILARLTIPAEDLQVKAEAESLEFNPEVLKAKYLAERGKRIHNGGLDQYQTVESALPARIQDPYVEPGFTRDPVDEDECEVLIVGAGFGAQLIAARLIEQGITNIRLIEKGGDFGGTWYWNRYPGASCDTESYIYIPLLEETNYIPTEKYARQTDMLDHAQRIGRQYGLYSKTLFQTEVLALRWDEEKCLWTAETNRNDNIWAKFVIPAAGPLHRPKLPGVPGIDTFQGRCFHSSRWDYQYTGGDNSGGLTGLADKRVGIVGTGATAVQLIPQLGEWAKDLYVFQRTPSSIDVRNNKATPPDFAQSLTPGWQYARMDNFATIVSGGHVEEDLVNDGWTDIVRRLLPDTAKMKDLDPVKFHAQLQLADYKKMESIRQRVDDIVRDKDTADGLKPWYNQFCKRPCFHDTYLPTFNRPNVHLVDTKGKGIERVTPKGVVANGGREYELDCLIYATGFEQGSDWAHRTKMEIYGRDGVSTSEAWRDGARTFYGWISRQFPNCFWISTVQTPLAPNFMHLASQQAQHISYVITQCRQRKIKRVEPSEEAQATWANIIVKEAKLREGFLKECTPSYFNDEGNVDLRAQLNGPYGGGAPKYYAMTAAWRDENKLEGLELKYSDEVDAPAASI